MIQSLFRDSANSAKEKLISHFGSERRWAPGHDFFSPNSVRGGRLLTGMSCLLGRALDMYSGKMVVPFVNKYVVIDLRSVYSASILASNALSMVNTIYSEKRSLCLWSLQRDDK